MDDTSTSEQMKRCSEYFVTRVRTLEDENKILKLKILELEQKIRENKVCVCVERHEEQTREESRMDSSVLSMSSEVVDSTFLGIHVREEPVDELIQDNLQPETPSMNEDIEIDIIEEETGFEPSLTTNVLDRKVVKSQPQVSSRRLFGQKEPDLTTLTGEKTHTCETCSETFETQCELLEHKRSHTGDKGIRTDVQTLFNCSICKTSFSTESILTDHKRTHTGDKSSRPLSVANGFSAKRSLSVDEVNAHGRLKKQRIIETEVEVSNDEEVPAMGEGIDTPSIVERNPLQIQEFDFTADGNCIFEQISHVIKIPTPTLLSLPNSVWSHILDYMDLHNLKKLRRVCKQTKIMVEQPEYLQKFKITLETIEDQEKVLSSNVPWNNFVLKMCQEDYNEEVWLEFLSHFGKPIEHLEIQEMGNIDISSILSDLSPRIQRLIIDMVHTNPHTFQSPIWAKNFIELKKLDIYEIMNFPGAPKTLFEIILDNCTHHLQHLWIPSLTQSDDSEVTKSDYRKLILRPVLNYLKRIEQSKVQTNLVIDFDEEVLLSRRVLLPIVETSSRLGVRLHNVPIHGFPKDNRSLTSAHRKMFDKCIVSIEKCVGGEMGSKKRRYVPKNAKIHVRINMNGSDENYHGYDIRGPIHSMQIAVGRTRYDQPYKDVFQTQWPTVGRLEIYWFNEREENPLINFGRDISFSFRNLKDISVSNCPSMRTEYFHALIHGLPNLEKLKVLKSNLNDEGLLGNNYTNPYILKLKSLKQLELLFCNELTDLSFTTAFRFMQLQKFRWTYEEDEPCHVTFLNGISSLSSIDGGLKDTLQHLEFKSPGDCSREEVDEFINKFKCLSYFKVEKLTLLNESESETETETDSESDDGSSFSMDESNWKIYSVYSDDENEWEGYPEDSDEFGNDEIENGFSEDEDVHQLKK